MASVKETMETPKRCGMIIIVQLLLLGFLTLPVWAQGKGWEKQWNEILAAARKEGRVVVATSPHETLRRTLPAAFKKRFGITLEYLGGRSSGTAARLRAERRAKVYTIDAMFGGSTALVNILYAEKMMSLITPTALYGHGWDVTSACQSAILAPFFPLPSPCPNPNPLQLPKPKRH